MFAGQKGGKDKGEWKRERRLGNSLILPTLLPSQPSQDMAQKEEDLSLSLFSLAGKRGPVCVPLIHLIKGRGTNEDYLCTY